MENRLEVFCLDFYGLPGCGKSTISHLLADKIRCEANVIEPSYHIDHGYSTVGRFIKKSLKAIGLFVFHPRLFVSIAKVIASCGYNCLNKDFYIHLLNIAYKIGVLNAPPKGFVIFDQGLWQSVISLFYRKEDVSSMVSIFNRLNSLISERVQYVSVYIQVDVETAIERMDTRHAAISRVQLLNNDDKTDELKKQLSIMEGLPSPRIIVNSAKNDINGCVMYLRNQLAGLF